MWIPYSYKFSRGQIFAHFVCAKINYFRADLFSRTFKMINFCADKISRTSFFSTSKTLKFTPKSAVLWRKLFHIVLKIFARINFRAPVQNLRKFGTYFRAISRKIGLCAKMRENLYARKLVRIRYMIPPAKKKSESNLMMYNTIAPYGPRPVWATPLMRLYCIWTIPHATWGRNHNEFKSAILSIIHDRSLEIPVLNEPL